MISEGCTGIGIMGGTVPQDIAEVARGSVVFADDESLSERMDA